MPMAKTDVEDTYVPVISPLLASIQFLTIIRIFNRREAIVKELGQTTGYFPLVGLLIGCIISVLYHWLNLVFSPEISAALLLAFWIILTGALHLDGLVDTCDGLFGGKSPEHRLKIMRDEQIGAFGFIGGFLLLLLKYLGISALISWQTLMIAPVIGRWIITFVLGIFPYAREKGLGREMKDKMSFWQIAIAGMVTIVISCWVAGIEGLVMMVVLTIFSWGAGRYIVGLIGGLTGDSYGALCEMSETVVLIMLPVLGAAFG